MLCPPPVSEAKVREILRLNLERWLAEKKPKP